MGIVFEDTAATQVKTLNTSDVQALYPQSKGFHIHTFFVKVRELATAQVRTLFWALHQEGNLAAIVIGGQVPLDFGTVAQVLEIQQYDLTAGVAPTGGTYTLTFDGQETLPIDFDASAAIVDIALTLLPNITSVNVTGGPSNVAAIDIEFVLPRGDVPAITIDSTGLTGGSGYPASTTETQASVYGDFMWFMGDSHFAYPPGAFPTASQGDLLPGWEAAQFVTQAWSQNIIVSSGTALTVAMDNADAADEIFVDLVGALL
jgi:hypothetical protein